MKKKMTVLLMVLLLLGLGSGAARYLRMYGTGKTTETTFSELMQETYGITAADTDKVYFHDDTEETEREMMPDAETAQAFFNYLDARNMEYRPYKWRRDGDLPQVQVIKLVAYQVGTGINIHVGENNSLIIRSSFEGKEVEYICFFDDAIDFMEIYDLFGVGRGTMADCLQEIYSVDLARIESIKYMPPLEDEVEEDEEDIVVDLKESGAAGAAFAEEFFAILNGQEINYRPYNEKLGDRSGAHMWVTIRADGSNAAIQLDFEEDARKIYCLYDDGETRKDYTCIFPEPVDRQAIDDLFTAWQAEHSENR